MEKKEKLLIIAIGVIIILIFLAYLFLRGGWLYLFFILGFLTLLFFLSNFVENFSPKSKIGKFGIKILTLIKDFIDEMMKGL